MENNQMNAQKKENTGQELDAKTVVNGVVHSLKDVRKMEEQLVQSQETGIQSHHDNSTEAVNAGEVASDQTLMQKQQEPKIPVRQANMQSGQKHFETMAKGYDMNREQKMQQADHDAVQGSVNGRGARAKANSKKAE